MKLGILQTSLGIAILGLALVGLSCASHPGGHGGGHAMACCKCSCKMMESDPANPGKCKMCGHDAQDHSSTNAPSATPHQH